MQRRSTVVFVFVALMVALSTAAVAAHQFNDVPDDHVFHDDIAWLSDNDITRGCNPPANDEFCPEDFVTRGQMAAFLHRFANNVSGEDGVVGPEGPQGPPGPAGPAGVDGVVALESASLAAPTPINIGGPINDNNTDLEVGLELPAGTFLVMVDGVFIDDTAYEGAADVWPQLSLWIDRDHNDAFQWQNGEGDISPNALMPKPANRHASVSGTTVITLSEPTYVGLLGFGYTSTAGSERSGEIEAISATLIAIPVPST